MKKINKYFTKLLFNFTWKSFIIFFISFFIISVTFISTLFIFNEFEIVLPYVIIMSLYVSICFTLMMFCLNREYLNIKKFIEKLNIIINGLDECYEITNLKIYYDKLVELEKQIKRKKYKEFINKYKFIITERIKIIEILNK